jgi:hypothetical protein
VNLDLFVGGCAVGCYLLCFGGVEGSLKLVIVQFSEDFEAVFESGDGGVGVAGVFVSEGASFPDVFLQHEIGLSVANTHADSLGIVGEVYHSVFNFLEICGFVVLLVEHPVLPGGS